MFLKRLGITALLWAFLVLPLSASMVSFLVIETGLLPDADAEEYSSLWEGGLMGSFFDAGHIVSNSPLLRLDKAPAAEFPQEAQSDFQEASEGGADYFVMALLEYSTQEGKAKPREISVRIFTIAPQKMIYEQHFALNAGSDLREEKNKIQETAGIIAAQIRNR